MGLLKDGYKHFSGVQEAVLKNTEAVKLVFQLFVDNLTMRTNSKWPLDTRAKLKKV